MYIAFSHGGVKTRRGLEPLLLVGWLVSWLVGWLVGGLVDTLVEIGRGLFLTWACARTAGARPTNTALGTGSHTPPYPSGFCKNKLPKSRTDRPLRSSSGGLFLTRVTCSCKTLTDRWCVILFRVQCSWAVFLPFERMPVSRTDRPNSTLMFNACRTPGPGGLGALVMVHVP